jgi:uncharacterized protein (TIGR03437 family)
LRVDRRDGTMAFLVNSPDITANQWQYYQVSAPIAADGALIYFGVLNYGSSNVWVDDASLATLQDSVPEAPRPLSETGLANLTAFAKVVGFVRHFHPSDQAAQTDWDAFSVQGVRTIEDAATADELASRLQALFDPIAPTVRIFATGNRPALPVELQPPSADGLQLIRWNHYGVNLGSASNIYQSIRQTAPADSLPSGFQDPAQPYETPIGRGLSVMVPLTLYSDSGGTLPHRARSFVTCCTYSADDRGTRLGGVAVAWNVAQHFYPYFDVVETDWPAALAAALGSAATDSGTDAYFVTLSRLWAALHDGHGWVWGPQTITMAPLMWDWVEDQLVVTVVKSAQGQGVVKGDRVLRIDGTPAESALAAKQQLISGATPQWILYRALMALAQCNTQTNTMQLEIEPWAAPGTSRTVQFTCGTDSSWLEPRPNVVQELEPGVMYVDINSLTDAEWSQALPSLASAKGIVFDLRGYPQSMAYFFNLGTGVMNSAQFWVPTPGKPDQVDFTFEQLPSWVLPPAAPFLSARRVFLTDGRAVSFAESVMGIVEAYQLAEIVGSTTAGTNGNMNFIYLPGGFELGFTGMKVLKNDGSQHHGVGIHATIPAGRTRAGVAAGSDEVLARGVEVVKGPQAGPVPAITAVVNAASYAAGAVAPGEMVTIFGTNLGPAQLAQTSYDGSGYLGTYAGETRVFFDNIQAPLVYASSTQVSAIVPYQVAESSKLRVEYQLRTSATLTVPVVAAAPGIFGVVVNQNGHINAASEPAARGEIVTLFATGDGRSSPAGVTGKLPAAGKWGVPSGKVAVAIGGVAGEVQWAGEILSGVLQVNVKIPSAAPVGNAVQLALTVGGVASAPGASMAVK